MMSAAVWMLALTLAVTESLPAAKDPKTDKQSLAVSMARCQLYGDPHLSSFDGFAATSTRSTEYLMAGTCGNGNSLPLTVIVSTDHDGRITVAQVGTRINGAPIVLQISGDKIVSCIVNYDFYTHGQFEECQAAAYRHGVNLQKAGYRNQNLIVEAVDGQGNQQWQVETTDHGEYIDTDLRMRHSVYAKNVRGLCGEMNGNRNDDNQCWTQMPFFSCWQTDSLKGISEVDWKLQHWPSSCPKMYHVGGVAGAAEESELPADAALVAAAEERCQPLADQHGLFAACPTVAGRRTELAKACVFDEARAPKAGACGIFQTAAKLCRDEDGIDIDLKKLECKAH